ncbi:MAG: hypothetical protein EYC62_06950 [Alphaproteobacteria bacterium]|nr:MAG: hypothetical protein EYC62_06950 [Alphaproteobacteria bacterium]
MKNTVIVLVLLISLAWAGTAHAEMTRIYHLGKPTGKPAANAMVAALSGVGASPSWSGSNKSQVWAQLNDAQPSQYTRYGIMHYRTDVSDFLRTSRSSSRGINGITSSTLDNDLFFSHRY